ncbi:4'-phosphopantetheinyl transferase superfamily protein [Streptomyces goshikiensis]|uniref:4'-phosphopantetheinyl transferase superfamily protein n=1 Tax=Streptomyces goshikiensis TaxID=1942 RepID=A0ABZ1RKK9_9ACTN|nr:4'-phosphopantetheinyl transferase superfamily protein [Streptomyces goshikiensis]
MTMYELGRSDVSAPIRVDGPDGPWPALRESVAVNGHVVVFADWNSWLPAVAGGSDLRALLGSRDWDRFNSLEKPEVRYRFAVSRMLLRHAASAVLEVSPDAVELAYRPGGRPYLRGCDQIDVSLSHTQDLVVIGLNRRGRIGVDTEKAARRLRYSEVHRQMCTTAERARLARMSGPEQEAELLRVWTLKEAYTKALGQGMRMGFNQFGFDAAGRGPMTSDGRPASYDEWTFGTYRVELGDGYLMSVACHDAGHGGEGGTAVAAMLDEGFFGQVVDLMDHRARRR